MMQQVSWRKSLVDHYWQLQVTLSLGAILLLTGCPQKVNQPTPEKSGSIIGKTTQDIGQHDPQAGKNVSDSKVNITNPVTGPLEAYGPMVERISKTAVAQALGFFHAEQGRYPKDFDEFMTEIIKKNNIQLPVLPAQAKYEYDVEKHELIVVKHEAAEEKK